MKQVGWRIAVGPILAEAPVPMLDDDYSIEVVGPRLGAVALSLLPQVLASIATGDPGDEQSTDGVTWAGHFGEDYATVDWSQPARRIHDQVRAWAFTFALSPVVGPVADLNGERFRLVRTSLTDPGDGAQKVETGDGRSGSWRPSPWTEAARRPRRSHRRTSVGAVRQTRAMPGRRRSRRGR